jgi:hypothetical protein
MNVMARLPRPAEEVSQLLNDNAWMFYPEVLWGYGSSQDPCTLSRNPYTLWQYCSSTSQKIQLPVFIPDFAKEVLEQTCGAHLDGTSIQV